MKFTLLFLYRGFLKMMDKNREKSRVEITVTTINLEQKMK